MSSITAFADFLKKSLNQHQRAAVLPASGILLVCAGAGSGKTRVITARITNLLLNESVHHSQIVALTFTNKAAREMKERVKEFLPETETIPFVGTFHSYCLRLLKTYSHLLPYPEFSILDEDDQKKLVQKILTDHNIPKRISAKQVCHTISRLKNAAHTGTVAISTINDPIMQKIFSWYEEAKAYAHCLDFDDLMLETLKFFTAYPAFQQQHQSRVKHLLVDEYQDTNQVQHALLKAMTLDADGSFVSDSLCVVGDEDQSIYSWRGATTSNIIDFKKDFPSAALLTIEQNYRSSQQILDVANHIIQYNQERNPKELWSEKKGKDRVRVVAAQSAYHEADILSATAKLALQKKAHSVAILYRSHYQSRAIEEILIRNSVPYKIIGGIQFYERQEIKDLLAYLRLIVNPYDRISFMRIINTPARTLGKKFEELFMMTWDQEPLMSYDMVARKLIETGVLTPSKEEKLEEFLSLFENLAPTTPAHEALGKIISKTSYFAYLTNSFDTDEAAAKTENVKELTHAFQAFFERSIVSVRDVLDEIALLQEHQQKREHESNCVYLMTLHAAKGLEFDTVMLAGLEEGVFPSGRSIYEPDALEEERRLLYVGITRAREYVLITHAHSRYTFGQMNQQSPSRFLSEIPEKSARFDDARFWRSYHISDYCTQWLNGTSQASYMSATTQQTKPPHSVKNYNWNDKPFDEEPTKKETPSSWRRFQSVHHTSFGVGIIQKIEKKDEETTYLTIRFSAGTKKIDARFIQKN